MSIFRVQLKQGQRTIVETVEASSVDNVVSFFNTVSTMKLTEVLEVKYLASDNVIPPDDFQYTKLFKCFVKNDTTNLSRQLILHNIKNTVSDAELYQYIKQYLDVNSLKIDSINGALFKKGVVKI
ncbi:MAG: hypothetical protein QM490_03970 [Candidatus Gracilibacteria bacterium]